MIELTYNDETGKFQYELYNPSTEILNRVLEFVANNNIYIRVSIRFVAPNVLVINSTFAWELISAVKEIIQS